MKRSTLRPLISFAMLLLACQMGLPFHSRLLQAFPELVDTTALILTAGGAEIAAGSVAMGLGGYLAARTDAEHYETELRREHREILEVPEKEAEEVAEIFKNTVLKKSRYNRLSRH